MDEQDMELLRGVLVVAVADGKISRGEKGVIQKLARKTGIGRVWLDEMIEKAKQGVSVESSIFRRILQDPARAMTLMVGTAAIDGEITDEERSVLVDISLKIGLPPGKFGEVFEAGMTTAARLRKKRSKRRA